ncbi:hypothetical protein [Streptomyces sp. CA-251247]|uniref:hypothetical protein n=1 Tax=Streptomyces sp. CA-251247 TaxID=3240062 RepID=UPI003D94A82A
MTTEGSEFVEDEPPAEDDQGLIVVDEAEPSDEFVEHVQPNSTLGDAELLGAHDTERHMYETRRKLAMGLLWLVGALASLPTVALIFGHWLHFKSDDYREVSLVFTPIVALASAAFGFFFASDERRI